MWACFGFYKSAEVKLIEDGYPVCVVELTEKPTDAAFGEELKESEG